MWEKSSIFIPATKSLFKLHIMRKFIIGSIFMLASLLGWSQPKSLAGFNETAVRQQLDLESTFDGYLRAANIDSGIRFMSSHPHHVGSPWDKTNADYIY